MTFRLKLSLKREAAERLEKWRKREAYSVPGPFTYLRINRSRELVETSQGVEMGLQAAKGLYKAIRDALAGRQDIVGHFVLDRFRISEVSKSQFIVGCHCIPMTEIEAVAAEMGW